MTDESQKFWDSCENAGWNLNHVSAVQKIDDLSHRAQNANQFGEDNNQRPYTVGGLAEQALNMYASIRDHMTLKVMNQILTITRRDFPDKHPRYDSMADMLGKCRAWSSERVKID